MKTIAVCMLALALMAAPALAEGTAGDAGIVQLDAAGSSVDLDGDGAAEAVALKLSVSDTEETYILAVNGATAQGRGVSLNGGLYALKLGDMPYLVVTEDGPSDDPYCYFYRYRDGELTYAGGIPAYIGTLEITREGITCVVRGSVLQTWFRPGDFIVAQNGYFDENWEYHEYDPAIVEVPRAIYPMGTTVTLKTDLTLRVSPTNPETAIVLKAGTRAVVAATDDVEWIYIVNQDPANESAWYNAGWLRLTGGFAITVDGQELYGADVFDGLLYAD